MYRLSRYPGVSGAWPVKHPRFASGERRQHSRIPVSPGVTAQSPEFRRHGSGDRGRVLRKSPQSASLVSGSQAWSLPVSASPLALPGSNLDSREKRYGCGFELVAMLQDLSCALPLSEAMREGRVGANFYLLFRQLIVVDGWLRA
jgi:hypothetical protein